MPETTQEVGSIPEYLDRLREELAGSDPALIQDAIYDAEEYLRNETALAAGEDGAAGDPAAKAEAAFARAVQRFGSPREVAEAYHQTDARVTAALAPPMTVPATDMLHRIFGVFLDPRAYGSLLYMFLSLATGILYFTWAVTGLSLSLGLSVLIIGLPFFLFFLASIRLFSLVEGRIVEALLGVRMPRRPQLASQGASFWLRLRSWLRDRRTWTSLLYMVLKLPLGIFSFVLFTILMVVPLALLAAPFFQLVTGLPPLQINGDSYFSPVWSFPVFWLAGLLDLLLAMHLARALGRVQGSLVKAMLVGA